ncbi:MAG: UDP-glucose--hexose-1-phosphate uridylyltransferase [Trueperaceae bacterium]
MSHPDRDLDHDLDHHAGPTTDATLLPHRRLDPLSGGSVLVSPHRTQRPWQGRQESAGTPGAPRYDPTCYLCPGNARAGGQRNPDYAATYLFDNDFPALLDATWADPAADQGLLAAEPVRGRCQVICFSPRHDLTLAGFGPAGLRRVVDLWADRAEVLGRDWRWVQIFENQGQAMGASNPHPHGQVWALDRLPDLVVREDDRQRAWADAHGEPLLVAYERLERERAVRTVLTTEAWTVLVPWWAVWPYELLIVPRRPVTRLPDLRDAERNDLAALLDRLFPTLDALFDAPFPYSMGWHGAPSGPDAAGEDASHWQLHAHVYPPLLRSATVRKFMVGFEMLGEPQRDLTPERAAADLRDAAARAGAADGNATPGTGSGR